MDDLRRTDPAGRGVPAAGLWPRRQVRADLWGGVNPYAGVYSPLIQRQSDRHRQVRMPFCSTRLAGRRPRLAASPGHKRGYGLRRSALKGHDRQQTNTGWGILAIGQSVEGDREVLGIWWQETEAPSSGWPCSTTCTS